MSDQWWWSVMIAAMAWPWLLAAFVVGVAVGYCFRAWRRER